MPINALLVREAKLATDSEVAMMAGLLDISLPIPKPISIPNYNPNPESEDMGAPVTPAEALQVEKILSLGECCKGGKACSCGEDSLMIQRLAWVISEMRKTRPLFFILKRAKVKWGEEIVEEMKRLVEEAQFV